MALTARVAPAPQLRSTRRAHTAAATRMTARPAARRLRPATVASGLVQPTPEEAARFGRAHAGPAQGQRQGDVMGDAMQLLLKQRIVFLGSQVAPHPRGALRIERPMAAEAVRCGCGAPAFDPALAATTHPPWTAIQEGGCTAGFTPRACRLSRGVTRRHACAMAAGEPYCRRCSCTRATVRALRLLVSPIARRGGLATRAHGRLWRWACRVTRRGTVPTRPIRPQHGAGLVHRALPR
jgi:hypothetical protein